MKNIVNKRSVFLLVLVFHPDAMTRENRGNVDCTFNENIIFLKTKTMAKKNYARLSSFCDPLKVSKEPKYRSLNNSSAYTSFVVLVFSIEDEMNIEVSKYDQNPYNVIRGGLSRQARYISYLLKVFFV